MGTSTAPPQKSAATTNRPWRKKSNKAIEVEIDFRLPGTFSIHKSVRQPLANLGIETGKQFSLRKRWTRDPVREETTEESIALRPYESDNYQDLSAEDSRQAARFIKLIRFRYIPNHFHPSELLAAESGAVQEALIVALKRKRSTKDAPKVDADAFLKAMSDSAKALVAPVNSILAATPGHVQGIALETPNDWAEVVWSLALQIESANTRSLPTELHGSGNQTFLAYLLISYLDRRFADRFGWHQATLWAVEEPESFLHADLEKELANFLRDLSEGERFQSMLTTHEPLFAANAHRRYEVWLREGKTTLREISVAELADRPVAAGISSYVHPLNLTTIKPTLVVEGKWDVFYIEQAYLKANRLNPWDVRTLADIDPMHGGGNAPIKGFLAQNQGPLRARPSRSPVVVLLDPDVKDGEVATLRDLLKVHPTSLAVKWPADKAGKDFTDTIRGIELYLSPSLFQAAAEKYPSCGIVMTVDGRFGIEAPKKSGAKKTLAQVCRDRDEQADVQPLIELLSWLEAFLPKANVQIPAV